MKTLEPGTCRFLQDRVMGSSLLPSKRKSFVFHPEQPLTGKKISACTVKAFSFSSLLGMTPWPTLTINNSNGCPNMELHQRRLHLTSVFCVNDTSFKQRRYDDLLLYHKAHSMCTVGFSLNWLSKLFGGQLFHHLGPSMRLNYRLYITNVKNKL